MTIHLLFDLFAYLSAFGVGRYLAKPSVPIVTKREKEAYFSVAIIGFVTGSIGLGSLNTWLSSPPQGVLGKSILGALLGGILAIEIFKRLRGIRGSTGAYFTPSLALGIAVGRIGCFLAGLEDYTYGVETSLPWGVDFGDGMSRHPVQLYESITMFLFFIYALWRHQTHRVNFEKNIFYQFILVYGLQRFVWELLKPYETVFSGLNIFGIACILLILYALYNLRRV